MENIATIKGHYGGITHLHLSSDNIRLYSGARKVFTMTKTTANFKFLHSFL